MGMNLIYFLGVPLILLVAFVVYRWVKKAGKSEAQEKVQHSNVIDFTGEFERKHYRFHNGLEVCQEQMGLDQNEEFTALLAKVEVGDIGTMDMQGLNKLLYEKQGMRDLLGIILLNNDGSKLNAAQKALTLKLKDDEVEAVLEDFFTLNPQKKALFELIKIAAVSQMMNSPKTMAGG